MEVREVDLPGVGRKFAITTDEGDRLSVIIHNTGEREIYSFQGEDDFPSQAVRLEDEEARKLSAILGGAYFQPAAAESVEVILEQLSIKWVKIESESPLADRTIAELELRKRTGASVIAILREGSAVPNPNPNERLFTDDTLVVVGSKDQVTRFLAFSRGEDLSESG